jgi:hypothetical protein
MKQLILCLRFGMIIGLASPFLSTAGDLKFHPAAEGFVFDTGVLRGELRAGGKSKGLTRVVHIPTGAVLDKSMGLAGHYRVFTANRRYGTAAWEWPSEAVLTAEGRVEVHWPAQPERPFELGAVYAWAAPDTLEVVTTVRAMTNLAGFESFLACYFHGAFTNSRVYVGELPGSARKGFLPATPEAGTWQVFPRDAAAMRLVRDGRWTIPPSPVEWAERPVLAGPLGLRHAPQLGLTAVLMARPEECFAVLTPHELEGHHSMYLSLFGRDLKKGEAARARARLWITSGLAEEAIVAEYERFLKGRE